MFDWSSSSTGTSEVQGTGCFEGISGAPSRPKYFQPKVGTACVAGALAYGNLTEGCPCLRMRSRHLEPVEVAPAKIISIQS